MPDLLSMVERSLKAVRYGFFCVNDQIALALDGLCHTPVMDYVDHTEHLDPDFEPHVFAPDGTCRACDFPVSAVSPQAADADSTPEAAASRPSAKSALTTPAEGHLTHQKSEGCWCDEWISVEGSEQAVIDACSHFRIIHRHRNPK